MAELRESCTILVEHGVEFDLGSPGATWFVGGESNVYS